MSQTQSDDSVDAASFEVREAALNSDRYRDVGQYITAINDHLEHAKQYTHYLFQDDVDPARLQRIGELMKAIDAELQGIDADVQQEESVKIVQSKKKIVADSAAYEDALKVYASGNIRRAKAMFSALAKTSLDKNVRDFSLKCVNMIHQFEIDQQAGK